MQPDPLDELINALAALRDLRGVDPVEGVRRCPALIDSAKALLSATRGGFALEATDHQRADRLTQEQLADQTGVSRKTISQAIAAYRAHQTPPPGGTHPTSP